MRTGFVGMGTVAGAAVLALAGVAQGDAITFDSTTGPFHHFGGTVASFTATWTYTGSSSTAGILTLSIMNTTSGISPTGAITSLAFNTAAGTSLTATGTGLGDGDDNGPWSIASDTPPPGNIGTFDSVFTVDGSDYGGAGNGSIGIEVSDGAVTFTWAVAASGDGLSLSVFDFLQPNSMGFGFAVKFKGIGPNDDSDSVVLVPLPQAVWFGAIGLVGVVALRRRILI